MASSERSRRPRRFALRIVLAGLVSCAGNAVPAAAGAPGGR